MSLRTGLQAVKQKRYQQAVPILEEFCRSSANQSAPEYIKAQMGLVTAYHGTDQKQKAIAICQKLVNYPNPKVSNWAKNALSSLTVDQEKQTPNHAPSQLNPEQLLHIGRAALKEKRYGDAIKALEAFNKTGQSQAQAQTWLVRAYKGNQQLDQAIALCQQLTLNQDPLIKDWAEQALPNLRAAKARQQQAQTRYPTAYLPTRGGSEPFPQGRKSGANGSQVKHERHRQ